MSFLKSLLLLSLVALSRSDSKPSLPSAIKGAFFGALVGDALTLGSHYEYDAKKIKQAYSGQITKYMSPGEHMGGMTHGVGWGARKYHDKVAGEQTDYGDYNILVLEYLHKIRDHPKMVDLNDFIPLWQERMKTWKAWKCTQSKQTLQQVASGVPHSKLGGMSNAMSVRHAATFAFYKSEEELVEASRKVMFTHRSEDALIGGEFFARVTYRVLYKNMTPKEAIESVAADSKSPMIKQKVKQALDKVAEATDPSKALSKEEFVDDLALTSMARLWDVGKSEPIKVGKASPTEGTLPGAVYFIVKYDNLMDALIANAMVGGDNASRSIPIGMVLGAAKGVEAVPEAYKSTLKEWDRCEKMLNDLPLLKSSPDAAAHQEL